MKTMKFRLLATMITLAAVITIPATPTQAQRRNSSSQQNTREVENRRNSSRGTIEQKSATRTVTPRAKTSPRRVDTKYEIKKSNASKPSSTNSGNRSTYSTPKRTYSNKPVSVKKSSSKSYETRNTWSNPSRNESVKKNNSGKKVASSSTMSRRTTGYTSSANRNKSKSTNYSGREAKSYNAKKYNHNSNDSRYKPNKHYKGNNKYWTSNHYNNTYSNKHKNHYKHGHWNSHWEHYRWNHNSWRHYYSCYKPYSYRHHKYYYQHHHYGHVIRGFAYRPPVYVHNHVRYYCYDGYFFRYQSGVGYVLVDVPYGITFNYIPQNHERVYVNGYMYFRVGNLFFEHSNYGYQLVHYPERYYAYNDDYVSQGYYFDDIMY